MPVKRQALQGLRVTSRNSSSRKEKGPRRPPCVSQSHMPAPAPARTGIPDPPGSRDRRARSKGKNSRHSPQEHPSRVTAPRNGGGGGGHIRRGACSPANQGRGPAEVGGGASGWPRRRAPVPGSRPKSASGVILGFGHQPGFQTPEGEGCKSRCTVARLHGFLMTPSFCPRGHCPGSLEGAGRFRLFSSIQGVPSTNPGAQDTAVNRTQGVPALLGLAFSWG